MKRRSTSSLRQSERNRKILRRWSEGDTTRTLALAYEITAERVRQIVQRERRWMDRLGNPQTHD
jgi:Mor family transcriptional regulator